MPNGEWITPPSVIDLVRKVFPDGIDLDPASSYLANKVVGAKKYYTKDEDGLGLPWKASTLWLNPPYSKGLVDKFADKLIDECTLHGLEAITLVNSSTDAKWFQRLLRHSRSVCFKRGRVSFLSSDTLAPAGSPRHPNVFFYFGEHSARFIGAFINEGWCI